MPALAGISMSGNAASAPKRLISRAGGRQIWLCVHRGPRRVEKRGVRRGFAKRTSEGAVTVFGVRPRLDRQMPLLRLWVTASKKLGIGGSSLFGVGSVAKRGV